MAAHTTATHFHFRFFETGDIFMSEKPYMPALVGQASLHGENACMVYWTKGALRRICRQKQCETSFFSFFGFFSV